MYMYKYIFIYICVYICIYMDLAQVGEGARLTLLGPGASILLGRGRSSPCLPRPADQAIIISKNVFVDQFLKAKSLAQSSTYRLLLPI